MTIASVLAAALLLPPVLYSAPPPRNVIIDTDAGADDLLAIAFLLARTDIRIEAITIANGLAHVPAGAQNVLRLLTLAGQPDIPVYEGRATPLEGSNEFPQSWRTVADAQPGITLPAAETRPQPASAFAFLRDRLAQPGKPASLLALGPLTNIAEVLGAYPRSALAIRDLIVMGGAVRVPGNLSSGGPLYSANTTAEWNFYIDPAAARRVIETVGNCRIVPLDASNTVPFDAAFVSQFAKAAKSDLAVFAAQILASNKSLIDQHLFYAWDPLAAAALVDPAVLKISSVPLAISLEDAEAGRSLETRTARPIRVALAADPVIFRKLFLATLR